jgi:hypothetical protein
MYFSRSIKASVPDIPISGAVQWMIVARFIVKRPINEILA